MSAEALTPVAMARRLVGDRLNAGSWTRSDRELVDEAREIVALRAQVDGLLLDAVWEVEARGLARSQGCPSTRAWLRSAHRIAAHQAARLVRTAGSLRTELPGVAAALGSGAVSLESRSAG